MAAGMVLAGTGPLAMLLSRQDPTRVLLPLPPAASICTALGSTLRDAPFPGPRGQGVPPPASLTVPAVPPEITLK